MNRFRLALLPIPICAAALAAAPQRPQPPAPPEALAHFESRVRPLLLERCVPCHGPTLQQGGLRLDRPVSPETARKVLAAVRRDGKVAMPPSGALRPDAVAALARWVGDGAPWPSAAAPARPASAPWALAPLRRPALPKTPGARTPVDALLGRRPSPPADRRTLIRRLTFDLTGLPPTPEEVDAFLADRAPGAWERVVDRLLASPRYGEKWGRLWLDLARYADTAGENSDHPLPHAWRYRNWVIDAFNRNVPYDRFVQAQIAGDLMAGDADPDAYADGVVATGFLALARRFGHDIDQDVHLTYEDAIDTMGKAVLGLTLACARCHDHKFDPISQKDYYRLYGILDSTRLSFPGCEPKQMPRDLVPLLPPSEIERRVRPLRERAAVLDQSVAALDAALGPANRALRQRADRTARLLSEGAIPDAGEAPFAARTDVRRGDVLLLSVTPLGNHGADTTRLEWTIAEDGGKARRWSVADLIDTLPGANPHPDRHGNRATWCLLDAQSALAFLPERRDAIDGQDSLRGWRSGDTPSVFVNRAAQPVKVWTTLPPRAFFVHPGPTGPVAIAWVAPDDATVTIAGRVADAHPGLDGVGWTLHRLHDDAAPVGDDFAALGTRSQALAEARTARAAIDLAVPTPVAFAVAEGTPRDARIQRKGDPADLGETVPRGFLAVLGGAPVRDRGRSGRAELARWLTDGPARPLAARVWANRIWQGHFGRGIVATPSDFGARGAKPTHPALLEWLADELVRTGWDTKALHRRVVLSDAYQAADFPRRRLGAEELRDSLLFVSGELDLTPAQAHPFPPEATWSFSQHAPFAAEYDTLRRSVYVLQKRNRRDRFFALFDGPDPNASTASRDRTTVPTQALWFLNDPFVHARADALARRLAPLPPDRRVDTAWRLLFGRPPSAAEVADARAFVAAYPGPTPDAAWAAWARVLFASNEFCHVD